MEKEYLKQIEIDTEAVMAVSVFAKALIRLEPGKLADLSNMLWPEKADGDEIYRTVRMAYIINCTARIVDGMVEGLRDKIQETIQEHYRQKDNGLERGAQNAESEAADGEREEGPGRAGTADRENAGAAH